MCGLVFDATLVKKIEEVGGGTASICYQCGTCTSTCPLGVKVRKLLREIQLGQINEAAADENVWACATCKLCEVKCPKGVNITDLLHSMRILAFEAHKAPAKLEQALWSIYENGNPYGGKKSERAKWAESLNVTVSGNGKQSKYLLYAGCGSSYDPRLQDIPRSVTQVLQKTGADVSILGEKESCCGDAVYQIGEEAYLEELVTKNIETFKESGAETIVTISPHCLNMFRNVYPHFGTMPEVLHYTEVLSSFLDKGGLRASPKRDKHSLLVTYHDPCYLGRYYGVYEEPRKILENISGLRLEEMADSKENALCCGGGGGLMWSDREDGARPSHERVMQAEQTNAAILATSCPYCVQNFEDATKTKGLQLKVMDVSELLNRFVE